MLIVTKKQFRHLLLLQALLILISVLTPFVIPSLLDAEAAELYSYFSEPDLHVVSIIFGLLSIPFMVWAVQNMVALYLFRSYAPRHLLYITLTGLVIGLVFDPLGIIPITSIESMIAYAYTLLGGAILALVYTSNVVDFFKVDEVLPVTPTESV